MQFRKQSKLPKLVNNNGSAVVYVNRKKISLRVRFGTKDAELAYARFIKERAVNPTAYEKAFSIGLKSGL